MIVVMVMNHNILMIPRNNVLITKDGNMQGKGKCSVIGCPNKPTVTLKNEEFCSIHALEAQSRYEGILIRETEQNRIKGSPSDSEQ